MPGRNLGWCFLAVFLLQLHGKQQQLLSTLCLYTTQHNTTQHNTLDSILIYLPTYQRYRWINGDALNPRPRRLEKGLQVLPLYPSPNAYSCFYFTIIGGKRLQKAATNTSPDSLHLLTYYCRFRYAVYPAIVAGRKTTISISVRDAITIALLANLIPMLHEENTKHKPLHCSPS